MTTLKRIIRSPLGLLSVCMALSLAVAPELLPAQERESPPQRSRPRATPSAPPSSRPAPPPSNPSPPSASPSSPSTSDRGGSHHGGYRRGGRHRYGFGFGFGHRYGRYHYGFGYYWPYHRFYGSYYHYPYYPWGWTWYPGYTRDTRVGAIDLAIKPKKAQVYVDGEYVGTAGKFDGYPGYLWLADGAHQLVFYYEGKQTVARDVRVGFGPVRHLKIEMADGPSVAPEELFKPVEETRIAQRPRPERQLPREPSASPERPAPRADPEPGRSAALDLRGQPGRFSLSVEPTDASVYLDGRFLGSAEELARLHAGMMVDAGEHYLEVQRPGYESERVEFTVAAGDQAELTVELEPTADVSD